MTPQETANQAIAASLRANSLTQVLPMRQSSQGSAMLGCSGGGVNSVSHPLDVRSAQLLSNSMGGCLNPDNGFSMQYMPSQYSGRPLTTKDVMEGQVNGLYMGRASSPQFSNQFDALSQRPSVLSHGGIVPSAIHVQSMPASYPCVQPAVQSHAFGSQPLSKSLSGTTAITDAFDPGRGFLRGCCPEEKHSSNDKSSGSSNKSLAVRLRWKPNAHQRELLEQHFEAGFSRATPELHAAVQGCGHATENNVNVWLKNRASRHKKPPVKKQMDNRHMQAEDSDDENPWEDFKVVSRRVLSEVSGAVSEIRRSDVLVLASAIHDARQICCFGVGKEALVMRALASGLHHLGFESFFIDDTNAPPFESSSLLLVSAGPTSGARISGVMEEAISTGSRVIVFGTHTFSHPESIFTIQIPSHPSSHMQVGSDGEVMSPLPDPPQDALPMTSLFDLSLTLLCDCVCVMLKRAGDISPAKIRARHTNLE